MKKQYWIIAAIIAAVLITAAVLFVPYFRAKNDVKKAVEKTDDSISTIAQNAKTFEAEVKKQNEKNTYEIKSIRKNAVEENRSISCDAIARGVVSELESVLGDLPGGNSSGF